MSNRFKYLRTLPMVIGGLATVAVVSVAQIGEVSASAPQRVDIVGSHDLGEAGNGEPFYFKQGRIVVHKGETVTWRNLTGDPHSISIVDPSAEPATVAQMETCSACQQLLSLHAPSIGADGPQPPFVAALDNSKVSAGQPAQLKALGDSLLVAEQGNSYPSTLGGSITDSTSAVINAERGTTLSYFCALHPWMQGTIEVR